jgi:hypothetical protein
MRSGVSPKRASRYRLISTFADNTFEGGAGADWFAMGSGWNNNNTVLDFNGDEDKLTLMDSARSQLTNFGAANFYAAAGATAQDADDFIVFDTSTGILYYDEDGNGAVGAVDIGSITRRRQPGSHGFRDRA